MDELHPYQIEGAEFLRTRRWALMAHEMGLGKTVMAIRGLDSINAKRALIICPSVARINWIRELEKWGTLPRTCSILAKLSDEPTPTHTHVCSFDYATRNYKKLSALKWDVLIIDEAHFLKSEDAKRSKAILGREGIVRSSERCWLLTGTPAPNHPGELWIMLYTFGVTKLKYEEFVERYCIVKKTSYGLKISGAKHERIPELKKLLETIMLRRLKMDVLKQLPPISYGHITVEAGPVDVEVMPSFTKYFIPEDRRQDLYNEIDRQAKLLRNVYSNLAPGDGAKLMTMEGIQSSVSTMRRYVGMQKIQAATDLITKELESKAYEKIVVFAIHADVINTLSDNLRQFKPVVLFGKTDPAVRQKNIDKFQNNKSCKVFIGNIIASGTAITLTAAHHVLFVEQDWVPGNNAQAVMRCHRIGQEHPVTVRFMAIDGTLDETIMYILKQKTRDLTRIFD